MKRLLLVSHRPLAQAGGPTARWRALSRYLPDHGWEVDVLAAPAGPGACEFATTGRARQMATARSRVMGAIGRLTEPAFSVAGVRSDAMPLSMSWVPRGAKAVRRRLGERRYDAVLATGPPMAGPLAARAGLPADAPPFVVELRDLWAGSPAFDHGGSLLQRIERWLFGRAALVVACTPEAAGDLRARHPDVRVAVVSNGFEPELLDMRTDDRATDPLTVLHSGTLTRDRPLAPLLDVLSQEPYRSRIRLVLQGFMASQIQEQLASTNGACDVMVKPPAPWSEAVRETAAATATLVLQGRAAGDETAVAAKVFEYLALGKPVVCLSDGGATEALLRRLGADSYCARLGEPDTIAAALNRLIEDPAPSPLPEEALSPYDRRRLAARLVSELDALVPTGRTDASTSTMR